MFASGHSFRSTSDLVRFLESHAATHLTRFAPAPTGHLHLGHIVNAVYVWGLARALDGRVLLRIEDHDRQRSRTEFERSLLDDLDWLGFEPNLFPTPSYRLSSCEGRQSEREHIYRRALEPLIASGRIYGCDCSRARLTADVPQRSGDERPYPGTCRDKGLALSDDVGWRLRVEDGMEIFEDGVTGSQSQNPAAQCGDLLLRDRLGNWTYQCVAAIDDYVQGVTLVVRGQDLLASTGRQIRLARLVGRVEPPVFVHHPLIMKSAVQKLSKSDGDSGIRDLRHAGWMPPDVIGYAAHLAGLLPERRAVDAKEVGTLFR
jgi:glutamyl/glutaminyl-tRNA synthetase